MTILQAQPTDNVIAYYPFNRNANDMTGNGYNGNIANVTLTTDRLNKVDAAYYFNASNAVITLPNLLLPSSTAFSFGCWFKPMGNTTAGTILGQGIIDLRGQYQIALGYNQPNHPTNPNSAQFYIYSNQTAAIITSPNNSIMTNTWYHLMCNYGNNIMELYINGVLIGSMSVSPPDACSGYNNTVGKDYNLSLNRAWANGCIDEVIFYKRKLTVAEIQAIYQIELTQSEIPGLCPIQYSYDLSGNRTSRNVISLKSSSAILYRDSTGMQANNFKPSPFEENIGDQKIIIYPNPTHGKLEINIQGYETSKSVAYVYNAAGSQITTKSSSNSSMVVDLGSYPNGIYILKIVVDNKTSEWKIIKE